MVIYLVVVIFLSGVFIFASACGSDVWVGSATFLGRRNNSTRAKDVASSMGVGGVTLSLRPECVLSFFCRHHDYLLDHTPLICLVTRYICKCIVAYIKVLACKTKRKACYKITNHSLLDWDAD